MLLLLFFLLQRKKHISVNLVNVKVKVGTKKNWAVLQNMTMLIKKTRTGSVTIQQKLGFNTIAQVWNISSLK